MSWDDPPIDDGTVPPEIEIARLQAQLRDAQEALREAHEKGRLWCAHADAERTKREEAEAALRMYGMHPRSSCNNGECTCGLNRALASLGSDGAAPSAEAQGRRCRACGGLSGEFDVCGSCHAPVEAPKDGVNWALLTIPGCDVCGQPAEYTGYQGRSHRCREHLPATEAPKDGER